MKPPPKSVHTLFSKFEELVALANRLERMPRRFGTDTTVSSAEMHLLELIGENPGCSVTDLAGLKGITKGAVSQSLKRLEAKGLIRKTESPENLSRCRVLLTLKGETAFDAHRQWHQTMDGGFREYMRRLDAEQIEFINDFMTRVLQFLEQRIKTGM
jgi:DNA-binding MarR family transcriptional regulator